MAPPPTEAHRDMSGIVNLDAARSGMERTIEMQARKGRASYLGVRSIGHQDPGATSSFLLIKAAADIWGT